MPNCFQLIDKTTGKPAILARVDDAMREHFCAPPSDSEYFRQWFDTIGFSLACGKSWDDLRAVYSDDSEYSREMLAVVEWLASRYESDSFYSPK